MKNCKGSYRLWACSLEETDGVDIIIVATAGAGDKVSGSGRTFNMKAENPVEAGEWKTAIKSWCGRRDFLEE